MSVALFDEEAVSQGCKPGERPLCFVGGGGAEAGVGGDADADTVTLQNNVTGGKSAP
ncbi:hypothetical protein LOZ80_06075 [Paenibacillus sp. HWE-109]|uniref:hypothetical protein n=1 Tax=Paenibacillus sp. HWE-109 TaxID=1306526 RepID=UPI001EDD8048|nr:hypothetical protein [Paenibacillus sp. HWE-109]UKS28499.1 hypothetical protein LOZ80_06075 [Paenibacillus sp. HWE-109]